MHEYHHYQSERHSVKNVPELTIDPHHPLQLASIAVNEEALNTLINAMGKKTTRVKEIIFRGDFWTWDNALRQSNSSDGEEFLDMYTQDSHFTIFEGNYNPLTKKININVDTIAADAIIDYYDDRYAARDVMHSEVAKVLIHELQHAVDNYTSVRLIAAFAIQYELLLTMRSLSDNQMITNLAGVSFVGLMSAIVNVGLGFKNGRYEKNPEAAEEDSYLLHLAKQAIIVQETPYFNDLVNVAREIL